MKTPITDAAEVWFTHKYVPSEVSSRLELDRAALIEALQDIASRDWIENALNPQDAACIAERALSAARANFPTE